MEIPVKNYDDHGLRVREECPPEGYVVVDTYEPHTSPWDVYGLRHQQEYGFVLKRAGIPHIALHTRRTIIGPLGSGPNGRVRLGDDWTPGEYRLAVPAEHVAAAKTTFEAHEADIQEWLKDVSKPIPEACRHAY